MATSDSLSGRVAGSDNALVLSDTAGNAYRITAVNGAGLAISKNGTNVGGLGLKAVVAKTGNYTCTQADSGTIFSTTGAGGAVNFTLPAAPLAGTNYRFINTVAQDMVVTAGTADTMVVGNDAEADSIAFSTSNEEIGAALEVVWDGAKWLTFVFLAAEAFTSTIVTA